MGLKNIKMTAKEFLEDYIKNHPNNLDKEGNPHFYTLTEFFEEVGCDYDDDIPDTSYERRHWEEMFVVQEINGRLIRYKWAFTTGDHSAKEKGWQFDPNTIDFVEPYTETITVTKYKVVPE